MNKKTPLLALLTAALLTACSSRTVEPEQYSGFLNNYSNLEPAKSASGSDVLRWVDPSVNIKSYNKLIYMPVTYYPEPKPSSQVGSKVLNDILAYTNTRLKASARKNFTLVEDAGAHTLLFKGAITAVATNNKGIQFYEVVPVALILAGTQVLTGYRTQETSLFFEGELVDSLTGKVILKVVRKGQGKSLSNKDKLLTVDDLKKVVDDMANDATVFVQSSGVSL